MAGYESPPVVYRVMEDERGTVGEPRGKWGRKSSESRKRGAGKQDSHGSGNRESREIQWNLS